MANVLSEDDLGRVGEIREALAKLLEQPLDPEVKNHLENAAKSLDVTSEQDQVSKAQQTLDQAKSSISAALGAISDPGARQELEQALQSLNGLTVNSVADASRVNELAQKAQETARAAEGQELQKDLMGAAVGLGGLAALLSNPEAVAAMAGFKNAVGGAFAFATPDDQLDNGINNLAVARLSGFRGPTV